MSHSKLSREQALALLQLLAADDAFRARFEAKPPKALAEIGVALETIIDLDPKCLAPSPLASKDVFEQALATMEAAAVEAAMSMQVPNAQFRGIR